MTGRNILLAAILLTFSPAGRAEPQFNATAPDDAIPDVTTNAAQASQVSPVSDAGLVLRRPTIRALPRDLSQLWMVPENGRVRHGGPGQPGHAPIKFEADGSHAKALALLSQPAMSQGGPLGFVRRVLRRTRTTAPRTDPTRRAGHFRRSNRTRRSGSSPRPPRCAKPNADEALGERAAALAVYERLAKMNTASPDEVLSAAGTRGEVPSAMPRRRHAAFERLYYEFPLSDFWLSAACRDSTRDPLAPGTPRFGSSSHAPNGCSRPSATRRRASEVRTPARRGAGRRPRAGPPADGRVRLLPEAAAHARDGASARIIDGGAAPGRSAVFLRPLAARAQRSTQYLKTIRQVADRVSHRNAGPTRR